MPRKYKKTLEERNSKYYETKLKEISALNNPEKQRELTEQLTLRIISDMRKEKSE